MRGATIWASSWAGGEGNNVWAGTGWPEAVFQLRENLLWQ